MRSRALMVDVSAALGRQLVCGLEAAGFQVVEARDGREGWRRFEQLHPDLVVTDGLWPGRDGLDLLARIRRRSGVPVVFFAAEPRVEAAVAALKGGADEFVAASDAGVEVVVGLARRCLGAARKPAEPELVGSHPGIQRARERLLALASIQRPVRLRGEPGTGLRTAARLLFSHSQASGRARGRFVHVTPRTSRPAGLPAHSLVYLDGLDGFARGEREHYREALASEAYGPSRARLVVSGSEGHGADGSGARLEVSLPPLRERPEDVPRIARALAERYGNELARPGLRLSDAALRRLREQSWPGNVGELARVVERLVAFSSGGPVGRAEVDSVLGEIRFSVDGLRERARAREREALVAALEGASGNVTRAALALGRSRAAVYRLVEKHGVPLRREP